MLGLLQHKFTDYLHHYDCFERQQQANGVHGRSGGGACLLIRKDVKGIEVLGKHEVSFSYVAVDVGQCILVSVYLPPRTVKA